mgnify:CR=1 FL=1
MDIADRFTAMPFADLVGVEVTEAADGHAAGTVEMRPELSSIAGRTVAHGGVTYTLADTVGGAAVISRTLDVAPTIDMRIDYVSPATTDLFAEAEVLRLGGNVGVADVEVTDEDDQRVATARGVYKTGGTGDGTPWGGGHLDELAADDAD